MPTLWNDLLNLLFPNLCRVCGKPLVKGEEQICLHCLLDLPQTRFHLLEGVNPVEQLFYGLVPIAHALSFYYYQKEGPVQKLIHSLKYYDNKELGFRLGHLAAQELQRVRHPICQVDYLIPVPLHPKKKRMRGYNQTEWIAKGIQSVWGCPVLPDALQRVMFTESQTRKSWSERRESITKALFRSTGSVPLEGKHVLLIDDVITTGTTIRACAEALSEATELRISLFSLAFV